MKRFLAIMLICAMLFFGCTSQQSENKAAAPATGQAKTTAPAAQTQAGASASAATGTPSSATAASAPATATAGAAPAEQPESAGSSFLDLMGMGSKTQWKIEYDITSNMATAAKMQMTQYMKGDKSRTDSALGGYASRIYVLGNKYYNCMQQASEWTCYEISMGTTQADVQAQIKSDPSKYKSVSDGTMQVAGVTANCFKLDNVEGAAMRYCFAKEGVPLYVSITSTSGGQTGTTVMTATSYTTDVSDSDFALPAAAQQMPSYPG